jgi:hypothetical protein
MVTKSINLMMLILMNLGLLTQTPEKQSPKPANRGESGYGAVHGRVFAVTNGGDLKPGRFVKVYLFFGSKISGNHVIGSDDDETPAALFLKARNEQAEQWNKASEQALAGLPPESIDKLSCTHDLLASDRAIIATIDSATSKGSRGSLCQHVLESA